MDTVLSVLVSTIGAMDILEVLMYLSAHLRGDKLEDPSTGLKDLERLKGMIRESVERAPVPENSQMTCGQDGTLFHKQFRVDENIDEGRLNALNQRIDEISSSLSTGGKESPTIERERTKSPESGPEENESLSERKTTPSPSPSLKEEFPERKLTPSPIPATIEETNATPTPSPVPEEPPKESQRLATPSPTPPPPSNDQFLKNERAEETAQPSQSQSQDQNQNTTFLDHERAPTPSTIDPSKLRQLNRDDDFRKTRRRTPSDSSIESREMREEELKALSTLEHDEQQDDNFTLGPDYGESDEDVDVLETIPEVCVSNEDSEEPDEERRIHEKSPLPSLAPAVELPWGDVKEHNRIEYKEGSPIREEVEQEELVVRQSASKVSRSPSPVPKDEAIVELEKEHLSPSTDVPTKPADGETVSKSQLLAPAECNVCSIPTNTAADRVSRSPTPTIMVENVPLDDQTRPPRDRAASPTVGVDVEGCTAAQLEEYAAYVERLAQSSSVETVASTPSADGNSFTSIPYAEYVKQKQRARAVEGEGDGEEEENVVEYYWRPGRTEASGDNGRRRRRRSLGSSVDVETEVELSLPSETVEYKEFFRVGLKAPDGQGLHFNTPRESMNWESSEDLSTAGLNEPLPRPRPKRSQSIPYSAGQLRRPGSRRQSIAEILIIPKSMQNTVRDEGMMLALEKEALEYKLLWGIPSPQGRSMEHLEEEEGEEASVGSSLAPPKSPRRSRTPSYSEWYDKIGDQHKAHIAPDDDESDPELPSASALPTIEVSQEIRDHRFYSFTSPSPQPDTKSQVPTSPQTTPYRSVAADYIEYMAKFPEQETPHLQLLDAASAGGKLRVVSCETYLQRMRVGPSPAPSPVPTPTGTRVASLEVYLHELRSRSPSPLPESSY